MTRALAAALAFAAAGCAALPSADPSREVADTERAFAKTMAERDAQRFASFVSEEAVFMSDGSALHGKAEVTAHWARFFTKPEAPFSWEPDHVEVLPSGTLAFSSGPVRDASGRAIGRFNSVWRREGAGTWRIVFDKGSDFCRCETRPGQ